MPRALAPLPLPARLRRDARGAALVEFALVLPILACLLVGMLAYAQYFLLAHSAQQFANDAARAAVAGLNAQERRQLAEASVARGVAALSILSPDRVTSSIADSPDAIRVTVRMDASGVALLRVSLLPMPSPVIERRASVLPGGAR